MMKIISCFALLLFVLGAPGQSKANSFNKSKKVVLLKSSSTSCKSSYLGDTVCLSYHSDHFVDARVLNQKADKIQVLHIENPSQIISSIDFSSMLGLEEVYLTGKNWDHDLYSIPDKILLLPNLKKIHLNKVSISTKHIKENYPEIELSGTFKEMRYPLGYGVD